MNIALLEMLRAQPDACVWPEALARGLGCSLRQVLRDLDELEAFGFGIERVPHRGVRFAAPARRLCPDQIEWQLGTETIGRRLVCWQRVASTNDVAAAAAHSPSNDGLVVLAEEQTAGRGRRRRRWLAPPETSILLSVLLFPRGAARTAALLTCLAAAAVADVIVESLALPARIKWPNDVRIEGKKVAGVLVEELAPPRRRSSGTAAALRPDAPHRAGRRATVIGIGINGNIPPQHFPRSLADTATSLLAACGRPIDRSQLARSLIQRLDRYYALARRGDPAPVWQRWRELADLVGRPVRVERACDQLDGRLVDLWPQRGVCLETDAGERIELPAGQVLSIQERPGPAA